MASGMDSKKLKVKCTYGDCSMHFETGKDMKRHKQYAPEHNYCKKCDVDCKDWDELNKHKVAAMWPWLDGRMKDNKDELPKHIVCEFCGQDFKSFGGRKLHRDQNHMADQNILCPGCDTRFTRAGVYLEHLENGRCARNNPKTGIMRKQFLENIQQKHVIKEIMKDPAEFIEKLRMNQAHIAPSEMSQSEIDSSDFKPIEDGGVPLLDQEDEDQKSGYQPLEAESYIRIREETWPRHPGLPDAPDLTDRLRSMSISSTAASVSGTEMSVSEYASTITSRRGGVKVYTESQGSLTSPMSPGSIQDFDDTASEATTTAADYHEGSTVWNTGNTSQVPFKDVKPTPMPGDWQGILEHRHEEQEENSGTNLFHTRFWDPTSPTYDGELFKNEMIGMYCCPFKDCNDGYEGLSDLEGHLRNTHLRSNYRCPVCLKIFKTAHALVSHSESGGRCKLKDSTKYDQLLDEISGGFLKAEHLRVPKVFDTSAAGTKRGGRVDGVMSTRFEAALPQ